MLPLVIVKAVWVKGMNINDMGASSRRAEPSRTRNKTPHSVAKDVVDLSDMEED